MDDHWNDIWPKVCKNAGVYVERKVETTSHLESMRKTFEYKDNVRQTRRMWKLRASIQDRYDSLTKL